MRALDVNHWARVLAHELKRVLLVLEKLNRDLTRVGKEHVPGLFEDRQDKRWRWTSVSTDSSMLHLAFYCLTLRADRTSNLKLLEIGRPLLGVMNASEREAASWSTTKQAILRLEEDGRNSIRLAVARSLTPSDTLMGSLYKGIIIVVSSYRLFLVVVDLPRLWASFSLQRFPNMLTTVSLVSMYVDIG
jgi:hypothetical protein